MRSYSASDSMEQAVFLNRQQCVYLEKSIRKKKEAGEEYWLAFVRKSEWKSQLKQFSPDLNCSIDSLRHTLEEEFSHIGNLECRFLDVDLLALLFSRCSEEAALVFCHELSAEFQVRFHGALPKEGAIAPALFGALYAVRQDTDAREENKTLKIGVSYQQNYLIDVVSRDRAEAKDQLLIEAVDQVILANHALSDEF